MRGHPLVRKVIYKYDYLNVYYKSGIIEKWILNRLVSRKIWVKSRIYNKIFELKRARWIDDVYDGDTVNMTYLYRLNNIEYRSEDISNYANWSFRKFKKLKQVDRKLFIHEMMDYFAKYKYNSWQKLPDNILGRDIEYLFNIDPKCHHHKDGINIFKLRRLVDFGTIFIKNFIPTHLYCKLNIYLSMKSRLYYIYLYNTINNLIESNKTDPVTKDFNVDNLTLFYKTKNGEVPLWKILPITYYRAIIDKYDLTGRSFLDIDPQFGEKSIASVMCDCDHYYVEVCPFDLAADGIANFFNKRFIPDDGVMRYDFSIVDFGLKFDMRYFEHIIRNYRHRVDILFILVPLELDAEANKICECNEKFVLYINKQIYGYYFVYR